MATDAALPTSPPSPSKLSFRGDGGTLFGIFIVNVLLSIVTFGIYWFWGKAEIRRYLYGQIEFLGDRFAWHGTGRELFVGALKAGSFFVVFYGIFFALHRFVHPIPAMVFLYVGILLVIPYAMWGTMRYRLSRTSWRGIRFSFRGRLGEAVGTFVSGSLLTLITLGIYAPYFRAKLRGYWTRNTYFGNTPFQYDGRGGDLLGSFLLAILLTIPTLYLCWLWFAARQHRYDWSHTSFGGARFASTVTGGALFGLLFVNLLLALVTLGIAFPWILVRNLRFVLDRLEVHGDLGLAQVLQDAEAARAGGAGAEGLADALDLGSAIG